MTSQANVDFGSLRYGACRWIYSGWPVYTILTISEDRLEFNVRLLFGLFWKKWFFYKNEIHSLEPKKGWWVLKRGFIINHKKNDYPMFMCYTPSNFAALRKTMAGFGWVIEDGSVDRHERLHGQDGIHR